MTIASAARTLAVALLAAGCGLPVVSGCGVPLKDAAAELANTCSADGDCGTDDVCLGGQCVSTKAALSGLLLQVDLPVSSPWGARTSTLIDPASDGLVLQGRDANGFYVGYDLVIPELVAVGEVRLEVSGAPAGCVSADDHSMPISVQLQPAEQLVGLPLAVYTAQSTLVEDQGLSRYSCSLNVPVGTYDIYIELNRNPDDPNDPNRACALPPVLLAGSEFAGATVPVNVSVSAPSELTGSIAGLTTNLHLTGWTIDLVENGGGRPISTAYTFGKRALGTGEATSAKSVASRAAADRGGSLPVPPAQFALQYWPEYASQALIRLTPPRDSAAMPTVLWRLDAVDLDGDHHVGLDLSALAAATPIAIQGSVLDDAITGGGVGAVVTIQSEELLGGQFGANVAYRATADAGSSGHFNASLLPGSYKVIAVPGGDPRLAITEATWKINQNDLGGGKTVVLNPKASLTSTVQTAAGAAAFDVPATLQPSTAPALAYLDEVLSTYDLLPNTATALTDPGGSLVIPVDPGVFDLSVRPDEASGFPWLVRARITIQPSESPTTADLGALALSNPVLLTGQVRSPDGNVLTGAVIRAWVPVHTDSSGGSSDHPTVIQIARALSDAQGTYTLRLPASISQ